MGSLFSQKGSPPLEAQAGEATAAAKKGLKESWTKVCKSPTRLSKKSYADVVRKSTMPKLLKASVDEKPRKTHDE